MTPESTLATEETNEKVRRRAQWESFSFEVPAPGQVTITNHSHGAAAAEHTYTVTVEDGRAIACTCPHFEHRAGKCKHTVRIEQESAVLAAAGLAVPPSQVSDSPNSNPGRPRLQADAGPEHEEACPNGDPHCDGPDGDSLSCFACYTLPGEEA